MAAHSSRTPVDTVDSSVDAPGSAFDSGHVGSSEIRLSGSEALPATGRFLGRVVYNASYAVSFGVTFPVMMIVRVMPRENALVHGFVDGALAARDRVYGWPEGLEEDHHEAEEHLDASENGTGHHEDSPARATRRRTPTKRGGPRKTTGRSSRKKA